MEGGGGGPATQQANDLTIAGGTASNRMHSQEPGHQGGVESLAEMKKRRKEQILISF